MAQAAGMERCRMSDFRSLAEILVTEVLPLLKVTPDEIKKIKIGNLEEKLIKEEEDGEPSD